jgi:hypothetical protein
MLEIMFYAGLIIYSIFDAIRDASLFAVLWSKGKRFWNVKKTEWKFEWVDDDIWHIVKNVSRLMFIITVFCASCMWIQHLYGLGHFVFKMLFAVVLAMEIWHITFSTFVYGQPFINDWLKKYFKLNNDLMRMAVRLIMYGLILLFSL